MHQRVLTGIKPTGFPHLGNYVGAIRPALERASRSESSYFFIADYHALNQIHDREQLRALSNAVAATWLACGLDTSRSIFYRQSAVPEIFELTIILAAFTPKSWMNKAHAYKAAVAANARAGRSTDSDVNMGLFTYPLMMAADILVFDTTTVPVGRDQVQHVEIARDLAIRFNGHVGDDVLVVPDYEVRRDAEAIPGIDGRKMSKSYGNAIPLFAMEDEWRARVYKIKTDSSRPGESTSVRGSSLYKIFSSLADPHTRTQFERDVEGGELSWVDAKERLVRLLSSSFTERRREFNELVAAPRELDRTLAAGAEQARLVASATLDRVRSAVGVAMFPVS